MEFRRDFFKGLALVTILLTVGLVLFIKWAEADLNQYIKEHPDYPLTQADANILPVIRDGALLASACWLLSWRNGAGWLAECRHQELLQSQHDTARVMKAIYVALRSKTAPPSE